VFIAGPRRRRSALTVSYDPWRGWQ